LRHLPGGLSVFLNICYRRTMTSKELDQLKKQINNIISELQDSDHYLEDVTQPIAPSVAIGRLTRMEAIGEKSVNEARHAKVKQRLERLKNAVQRIENGSYGICLRCSKEIPFGRLTAVPESLICIPCTEKKR
jgi:DnaK suppressor protein